MEPAKAERELGRFIASALASVLFIAILLPACIARGAQLRGMRTWAVTDATIERAAVHKQAGGKGGPRFTHALDYRYSVAGVSYTGHRASVGLTGDACISWRDEADALARLPPVGASTGVYYNPSAPGESVLAVCDPGAGEFVVEALLLGTGAFLAFVAFSSGRRLYRG